MGVPTGVAATDSANWNAALVALGATISGGVATGGAGIIALNATNATNYVFNSSVATVNNAAIGVAGPGSGSCVILAAAGGGAIPTLNFTSPATTNRAPISGFTVDGTNADAGAIGIEIGDGNNASIHDVTVQNFQGGSDTMKAVLTLANVVTNGTTTITSTSGFTTSAVGQFVIGTNIAPGSQVVSISGTNLVLSMAATGSGTGRTVYFGPSTGWLFNNRAGEMERAQVNIQSNHNSLCYVFTSTSPGNESFDYGEWNLLSSCDTNAMGVVFTPASNMIGGSFALRGNFGTFGGSNTSCAIALAGTGGVGGQLQYASLNINLEADGTGTGPQSFYIGPNAVLIGTGVIAIGSSTTTWVSSNLSQVLLGNEQIGFSGFLEVQGDTFFGPGGNSIFATVGVLTDQTMNSYHAYFEISTGNVAAVTLVSGANAVTLAGTPTNRAGRWVLVVIQPSSGAAGTLSGVPWTWVGSSTLQTANNAVDIIDLVLVSGTVYGTLRPIGYAPLASPAFTGTPTASDLTFNVNSPTVSSGAVTVPITSRINNIVVSATTAITIATTSAVDGQLVMIRITDGGSAETISWVNTENSTVNVPVVSPGSSTLSTTVGFIFNGNTSKWRCIGVA